ncbi:MAG: hypothetical protein GX371_04450 [Bacteroidales bacterium]|nr:hypothetical protein [Bacteroidales bacterium]
MANTRARIPKQSAKVRSLMLHSLGFITGDPSIKVSYPYLFHPGLQVTVNEPGDAKWIYLMLPITRGSLITDIKIAHHRTGIQSRVTLVRLVEQREPVSATVIHDEAIDKAIPSTCVINSTCRVVVNNSTLLKVCMNFANTDDMIEFGSVEICYIPDYMAPHEKKKKDKKVSKEAEEMVATYLFSNHRALNMHLDCSHPSACRPV